MGQPSRWVWGVMLCLTISSKPGSSANSVNPASTTVALAIEITSVAFNASRLNSNSEFTKMLDAEVTSLLDGIYDCDDEAKCPIAPFYGGVECITYSPGPLIANASIIFLTSSINQVIVRALFKDNIATALLQTKLGVNEDYTSNSMPIILDEDVCKKSTSTPEPPSTHSTTEPPTTPDPTVTSDPANGGGTSDPANGGGTSGPASGGGNREDRDWVPGWGIALLVLAAAILLLLIILFILLCIRCCRKRPAEDPMEMNHDPYYVHNKMHPQETLPVYYPSAPTAASPSPMQTPMVVGDPPKKNQTGFYAVNP